MPSKSFLRTDSKRNRPALLCAAACFMLAVLAPALGAQETQLATAVRDGIVCADLVFHWDREEEFIGSLKDGLESRITFTARLFDRRPALFPSLGNIHVETRTASQSAFYDFLSKKFVIETDLGKRFTYTSAQDLIRNFFTQTDITLAEWSQVRDPYVTARVQFEPVRLMPPLTIVSLVGATGTYTSPWIRRDVHP